MSKKKAVAPAVPTAQQKGVVVIDPSHAPIIFFDGAPNFGNNEGIINITLAAGRHMINDDKIAFDAVAVAFLRCGIPAAIALRAAIDKALLIGMPTQGGAN